MQVGQAGEGGCCGVWWGFFDSLQGLRPADREICGVAGRGGPGERGAIVGVFGGTFSMGYRGWSRTISRRGAGEGEADRERVGRIVPRGTRMSGPGSRGEGGWWRANVPRGTSGGRGLDRVRRRLVEGGCIS